MEFVPNVKAIVGDTARQAAVEESAQPNVLGAAAAEVDVRGAQDAHPLGGAFLGECDLEIADPDFPVPLVEAMEDQTAGDSQFVQDEVGQEAERVQRNYQHPEDEPVLEAELNAGAFRSPERERKVRPMRRAIGRIGGSGAASQH